MKYLFVFLIAIVSPIISYSQDTLTTDKGVKYILLSEGKGQKPTPNSKVSIYFKGSLDDGTIFDQNEAPYDAPFKFKLGKKAVIPGLEDLVMHIKEGSKVKAWISSNIGYGEKGFKDPDDTSKYMIPPNSRLTFELSLVKVK